MRIACLLVPDLPLRAELRTHPQWADCPLAVTSGADSRAQVIAAARSLREAGVHPPCSLTHARAVFPDLKVRETSLAADRAARQALLDIALSCAPRAELAAPATGPFIAEAAVFVDATGVASLFHSEQGFAAALCARAARLGFPGVVSVSSSRGIAHWAARATAVRTPLADEGVVRVLPPGSEIDFLAPLSLDLLDPDDRLAQRLTRFGVHRVRDLLALPPRSLAHRLGPEALQLVARARGQEIDAPLPIPPDSRIEESVDLESSLHLLEPLLFVLRAALSRILERLELRGFACHALDLKLELEGGRSDDRHIGMASPTRDPRVLLRVMALALEKHPPAAAVVKLGLSTQGIPLRSDQLDLFSPRGPDPTALDETLAELESLCGVGRVGAPEVSDDHRPDAFGMKAFRVQSAPARAQIGRESQPARTNSPPGRSSPPARTSSPPCAVRALRPPVSANVRIERGRPAWVRSAVTSGDILQASGPWRTTGNWWSKEERFAIDHYDVQVSDGTVVRLGFDYIRRMWQIDAIYD